jgi:hypothetical protein
MFGRAPKPALAPQGALPNGLKKRGPNKEHRVIGAIFIERHLSQKNWLLAAPLLLSILSFSRVKRIHFVK